MIPVHTNVELISLVICSLMDLLVTLSIKCLVLSDQQYETQRFSVHNDIKEKKLKIIIFEDEDNLKHFGLSNDLISTKLGFPS